MESWSIELEKQDFKYSAAHFLIFPDGSAERLHGHNYRVFVEVGGELTEFGLVLDFQQVKPIVRELLGELNERFLLPGEHPELEVKQRADGVVEVRYRERYYAAPREDVVILPINNTSSENMAAFLGRRLKDLIEERFEGVVVKRLRIAVEETAGQRGVWLFES